MLYYLIPSLLLRTGGAFFLSFFLNLFLIKKIALQKFKRRGLVDYFRSDAPLSHYKKRGIPTAGGIFIIISFSFTLLIFGDVANSFILIGFLTILSLGIIGFLDDRLKIKRESSRGLKVKFKLSIQFILSFIVALYLYYFTQFDSYLDIPFTELSFYIGWAYIPLMMAVVVGTTNSVNLTDGLDGLAGGCLIFSGAAYAFLTYLAGSSIFPHYLHTAHIANIGELLVFWGAILGAIAGFLRYNIYPARIFMGDTGAHFLGGALGITAILVRKELLLCIIGGVFLVEALSVILQVFSFQLTGKRIIKMSPLHHHYELKGMKEEKIVAYFWILSLILALVGLSSLFF
ncbi:MAG: phospho-N-acetylmuramoyl-pentapeptide-transferase [Candidatus Aerophobetes bacterium]|nr:phospho-N-acetylmuramoyl-pentapeptide-transferase [Candidatus Aerophobetes bacterium]